MSLPERTDAVSPVAVRRAVHAVLDGEGVGPASVSVTFVAAGAMRALNRERIGRDRATDVIAFGLSHPGQVVGDVYVCPAVAQRQVCDRGALQEELLRLVVHGTLHVLGYDHPDGVGRTRSAMWRRQERYVRHLVGGAA